MQDSSNSHPLVGPADRRVVDLTEYATLIVGDLFAVGPWAGDLVMFEKDYTPPLPGDTRMTFVHAMPGVSAVDVYVQGARALRKVVGGIRFKQVSAYIEITPKAGAANTVIVTRAGIFPNGLTDLVSIHDAVFVGGKIYIVPLLYEADDPLADLTAHIYEQL